MKVSSNINQDLLTKITGAEDLLQPESPSFLDDNNGLTSKLKGLSSRLAATTLPGAEPASSSSGSDAESSSAESPSIQSAVPEASSASVSLPQDLSFAVQSGGGSEEQPFEAHQLFADEASVVEEDHEDEVSSFQILNRWAETATDASGLGQGDPTTVTWSIVPDGTGIDGFVGEPAGASDLIAFFSSIYGVVTNDNNFTDEIWFPLVESSFNRWSELSGLTYVYEPNDDGAAFSAFASVAPGVLGTRGDVRIGGHFVDGNSGTLAYNFFPNNGEMVIDTTDSFFSDIGNNSLGLRNVVTHEAGHGLGLSHVESSDGSFLMEPFINLSFDGPQIDDILAVQRNYGDALEANGGNDTSGAAFDLGTFAGTDLAIGTDASNVLQEVLPSQTDFVSIDDDSDVDFYSFTVTSTGLFDFLLNPLGPTYQEGPEPPPTVPQTPFTTGSFSDLTLTVLDTDGSSILGTSNVGGLGISESIDDLSLDPGTYFAQITGTDDNVQLYDLTIGQGLAIGGPPVNDDFADATAITGTGSFTGDNTDATTEVDEPAGTNWSDGPAVENSIWWAWTAPSSGPFDFETVDIGGNSDTQIAIYTGTALNNLVEEASDDDDGSGFLSFVDDLVVTAGTEYLIQIDGWQGESGPIQLDISIGNDDFADATAITGTGSFFGDNTDATAEVGEPAGSNWISTVINNSIWYEWTAPFTGLFNFETINIGGANDDTQLAIYTGTALDNLVELDSDDDDSEDGFFSLIDGLAVTGGDSVFIQIDGFTAADAGPIQLDISEAIPPVNDDFADATAISGIGSFTGDNTDATVEVGEPAGSNWISTVINNSIWYEWTAPFTGLFDFETINIGGANDDTQLAIYTGTALDNLVELDSDDDDSEDGFFSLIEDLAVTGGDSVFIQVDGFAAADEGPIQLDITCFLPGTYILTETGETAVEDLQIGDNIKTADGTLEPIKWIARQTIDPNQIQNPLRGCPVLIKAGALGEQMPKRDLYVSPDHAMFVDGLLINAGALVNGVSILSTTPTEAFTYYHIELERHCLLVAEGSATESYLPQKEDRDGYDNGAEYEALYPHGSNLMLWPMPYPRVSSKATLPRFVNQKLLVVAEQLYGEQPLQAVA